LRLPVVLLRDVRMWTPSGLGGDENLFVVGPMKCVSHPAFLVGGIHLYGGADRVAEGRFGPKLEVQLSACTGVEVLRGKRREDPFEKAGAVDVTVEVEVGISRLKRLGVVRPLGKRHVVPLVGQHRRTVRRIEVVHCLRKASGPPALRVEDEPGARGPRHLRVLDGEHELSGGAEAV